MKLNQIYWPIQRELSAVEQMLRCSLGVSKYASISKIANYLLRPKGKMLRPALVILCAKATGSHQPQATSHKLTKIATAIELIHIASLIHDDVIDHAYLRHNKPTINSKWGHDVSIAMGDYIYAEAFRLIADCGNSDIISCISSATKAMCEGELIQVLERDNLDLLRRRYIIIVKKKTANLFAASCQAGTMLVNNNRFIQGALKECGLNFGIAFQIVDDCLDLIGEERHLGKAPGADFKMGELTLPLLNLVAQSKDKKRLISLLTRQNSFEAFKDLRLRFIHSQAFTKTKEDISYYLKKARVRLNTLSDSPFKQSLFSLADFIIRRIPY